MPEKLKPCPFCGEKSIEVREEFKALLPNKMKSVLISIKPKFCALIADGKRPLKSEKSRPKLKPCNVDNLIDTIISHNEIVAIWENRHDKNGKYHYLIWRGMAHQIPKEYHNRIFDRIFGTIPANISEADTINIAVYPELKEVNRDEKI